MVQFDSLLFDGCEEVVVVNSTVNDRLSIVDCGRVEVSRTTCRNVVVVKNTAYEVLLTDNLANNLVKLESNFDRVTLANNIFHTIRCTENPNIHASNNNVNQVVGNCGFN